LETKKSNKKGSKIMNKKLYLAGMFVSALTFSYVQAMWDEKFIEAMTQAGGTTPHAVKTVKVSIYESKYGLTHPMGFVTVTLPVYRGRISVDDIKDKIQTSLQKGEHIRGLYVLYEGHSWPFESQFPNDVTPEILDHFPIGAEIE
jgi:hypothetical protein